MKKKNGFRKIINIIHLWVGIPSALILFVVCLSGTTYVFQKEITRWVDSDKFTLNPPQDANGWMDMLNSATKFPSELNELQKLCKANNQTKPTVLILKYDDGGHNTLHQDLYGDIYFPMQLVLFLSEPGKDYTGGEFVLLQQTPRAQSKAIVLQPGKGDMLLFTTSYKPVKGSKGYYRVNMKHGVSEVRKGKRYTLGIIFHDAA